MPVSALEPHPFVAYRAEPDALPSARADGTLSEIDNLRHALYSIPAMAIEEEPEGNAWFAFGASVAWI